MAYTIVMLEQILGSKTAEKIFLHLYHYGESYPSGVAKDFKISLSQVQRQFERFENAGILISKLSGKTRVYQFNQRYPLTSDFIAMVRKIYDSLSLDEKESLFSTRRAPRRAGKPILGRKKP
jgi:DNA-binding transcriptional ArsR family regulator